MMTLWSSFGSGKSLMDESETGKPMRGVQKLVEELFFQQYWYYSNSELELRASAEIHVPAAYTQPPYHGRRVCST